MKGRFDLYRNQHQALHVLRSSQPEFPHVLHSCCGGKSHGSLTQMMAYASKEIAMELVISLVFYELQELRELKNSVLI